MGARTPMFIRDESWDSTHEDVVWTCVLFLTASTASDLISRLGDDDIAACALRFEMLFSSLTFCIACTDGFERCPQGCNPGIIENVGQLNSKCRARARQKYAEAEMAQQRAESAQR